ncbi:MAG: Gfo/Idh/MocA family oxidoreductase [Planctomycetota bacterium]|nr:Gfo/Idh/MocA family oxidoreductase [Planctomycetota bacterium]
MTGTTPIPRREFLERAAVAGGLVGGLAASLPAAAWARVPGANEVMSIGVIGCGPRGQQLARQFRLRGEAKSVSVVRVCDVYRPRLRAATEMLGLDATGGTMEYREIIDDPNIDAVVIATPDHWHAKMSIEALEAGKAVFVETPLSHTIEQAVAIRDAVDRTGGTFAVAAQRCSQDRFWQLRQALAEQRIGRVTWSQGSFAINGRIPMFARPKEGGVSPNLRANEFVWWDRWLGTEWDLAPDTPLSEDRFFRYQKYYDYSNGMAGELLFGVLAPMLLSIAGARGEQPRRVVSGGGLYNFFDGRETPDQLMAVLDFPGEHSIVMAASGTSSKGLEMTFRGRHGYATVNDDVVRLQEDGAFYPEFRKGSKDMIDAGMSRDAKGRWIPTPPAGEVGYELEIGKRPDVINNFIESVRGEADPDCGIDLAFAAMLGARMMAEGLRLNQVMLWDKDAQAMASV